MKNEKVWKIIEDALKNHTVDYYMKGHCYELAAKMALECGGEVWYSHLYEHCICKIKDSFFDVNGQLKNSEDFHKIRDYEKKFFDK